MEKFRLAEKLICKHIILEDGRSEVWEEKRDDT